MCVGAPVPCGTLIPSVDRRGVSPGHGRLPVVWAPAASGAHGHGCHPDDSPPGTPQFFLEDFNKHQREPNHAHEKVQGTKTTTHQSQSDAEETTIS